MIGFSPEEWHRLGPLLDRALDLEGPERADFLERTGREDPALRDELDRLVRAATVSDGFLDSGQVAEALAILGADLEHEAPDFPPGSRVGPYRILEDVGRGGMGRVYSAERADGLWERRVALKLVRRDLPSREILDRFLYERRILARLAHPNIAAMLDGGATEEGQPYFAMELVEGMPLTEYCDAHRLTIERRLDLFLRACDAVQYAHQSLVIHRDLKPSNIQVTEDGQVKLLDFGIAKILDPAQDATPPSVTLTGVAGVQAMTPEYAAPEQLLGQRVTTATDVYSLGVLLYELLTGHRPYRFERQTPAEIERVVCGSQPPRPSAVVTRTETIHKRDGTTETLHPADVAAARGARPERLKRRLKGDLELIVLKALQKDPERRYPTADALARDIRRFREGRPVRARPEALTYRLSRFVARNKAGVGAAAILALVLTAGVTATVWQASVASAEAARAGNVRNVIVGLFDMFDPQTMPIDSLSGRDILEAGVARAEADLVGQPDIQSELLATFGQIYTRLSDYDRGLPLMQEAIRLRRSVAPAGDSVLARILTAYGTALSEKGEYEEARRVHDESLAMRRRLFGADSPEATRGMAGIAGVLSGMGQYDSAITAYEEVLERDLSHHGDVHAFVAEDLGALASAWRSAGRPRDAEPYARAALEMRLEVSGSEHVETATAMNNLGTILYRQGDLAGADSLFRKVLEFDVRRFGDRHQYTATVRNNLAVIKRERGHLSEAEALFRAVVEYDLEALGRRHQYTPVAIRNLTGVLRDLGRVDEADRWAREAMEINRDLYGDDHQEVGKSWELVGSVQRAAGQHSEAEGSYLRALDILEQRAPDHADMATTLLGYGELLLDLGRVGAAVPHLERALAVRKDALGDGPATAQAEVRLGEALTRQGRLNEAEAHLRSALQRYSSMAWSHRNHFAAVEALASVWQLQGRTAEAGRLRADGASLDARP